MSIKSEKIAAVILTFAGRNDDPHYLAFFDCFNRGLFFEAHEVLEVLWLQDRSGPEGDFYKGLIQLAGAFVHIQKGRHGPASSLFRLAEKNFAKFPREHQKLNLREVRNHIQRCLDMIGKPPFGNTGPLTAPHLKLREPLSGPA